jgi:uncharacterized membrane protein YfcA
MSPIEAFGRVLSVGGIAGAIALLITLTICARYVTHGPEDIPQILTYSLSTIIGFYFGAGVTGGTSRRHDIEP